MVPFLQQLATELIARHRNDLARIAVVLPSRRAGLHLRKYLAKTAGATIWSPEVLDPGEFLARITGVRQGGSVELLLALHETHCKTAGAQAEPLVDFLRWAPVSLRDMSEIDAHQLDLDQVYRDLRAYHEIEEWSFRGTDELSRSQRVAREQWARMGALHRGANELFAGRGMGTSGGIARKAAEMSAGKGCELPWQHVWAAGLNALDPATTQVFAQLSKRGLASFAWDSDRYYADDPAHEAGRYLRRSIADLGKGVVAPAEHIRERERRIDLVTVPDQMAAVQTAGEWAARLTSEQREQAVIMLADESLLLPLLSALPVGIGKVNVTMGLPFESLPIHGLVERYLHLGDERTSELLPCDELRSLLTHPLLHRGESTNELLLVLDRLPGRFVQPEKLDQAMQIVSFPDRAEAMRALHAMMERTRANRAVQEVIAWAAKVQAGDRLGTEQLYRLAQAERELGDALGAAGMEGLDMDTYAAVRQRAMRGQRLALFGEPLAGLQVMGLLETRAVDHRHVLILGATEGLLGGSDQAQSWIPFDLRRHYGLPLHADAEAITSYHVHRLLHHAEEVWLVHAPGADGSASPTHFIAQWQHELAPVSRTTLQRHVRHVARQAQKTSPIAVTKSEQVQHRLAAIGERGFSPSALGTWLQCPLDFYFKYVLGLKERPARQDELGSDILGKAVHATLEDIYRPCIGSALSAQWLKDAVPSVPERLHRHLSTEIAEATLRTGDHHLRAAMAADALQRYLREEAGRCERMVIVPTAIESRLSATLAHGHRITGTCDRMEMRNGLLHLLDMKTSSVQSGDLALGSLDRDQLGRRHRYALQVLLYAFMAFQQDKELNSIRAGIVPLRKPSSSEGLWLRVHGSDILDRSMMDDMADLITTLITELMHPATAFSHDPESDHCSFCVA